MAFEENTSLASFSSTDNKKNSDQNKKKLEYKAEKKDFEEELNELDDFEFNDGRDLYRLINELSIEIDCMGKSNYKPIDFIMDRFKIQDDILVRIIKLFEFTLEEIIMKQYKYISETADLYFRLVERFHNKLNI